MKVSGTAVLCVTAVCVIGFGVVSSRGRSGAGAGTASLIAPPQARGVIEGLVETVGKTRKGKAAVTLSLIAEWEGEKTIFYLKECDFEGEAGDTVRADVRIRKVENFSEDFDYVGYMARKGVFFTCFQKGEYAVSKCGCPGWKYRIIRVRTGCIEWIRERLEPLDPRNSALLTAFLTGARENVDREVLEDFRASGMMHTLALSGLHVGVIYSILSFILSFLGNFPASRKARSLVVILCLWPYALLTGMGSSIFRAVVMASVYELAVVLERERSPLNALALSAIIVSFADPSAPGTLSFQLSFGAMAGIILFYDNIGGYVETVFPLRESAADRMCRTEALRESEGVPEGEWVRGFRKIRLPSCIAERLKDGLRKVWSLCALSVSCQIFTVPLVWVVFGTFAHWSMLANLLCTPLVGLSMTLAPVCLLLGNVPYLGTGAFYALDTVLDALRFCVAVMGGN